MNKLSYVFLFGAAMILLVCISKPDYFFKNKSKNSLDINTKKDSSSLVIISTDSIHSKKDSVSFSKKRIKILNKDIQDMVDICVDLNGIQNPNLIKNKQLIKWKFPDNEKFEFYEIVEPGQNLWVIAESLLIVTADYRTNKGSD